MQEGFKDWGLTQEWAKQVQKLVDEISASSEASAALIADTPNRQELLPKERAARIQESTASSEEAALREATANYWGSPEFTVVTHSGDGCWPPRSLDQPIVMRHVTIDGMEPVEKQKLAMQCATSMYWASTLRGAEQLSGQEVRFAYLISPPHTHTT